MSIRNTQQSAVSFQLVSRQRRALYSKFRITIALS
jgi:hypothetical protein